MTIEEYNNIQNFCRKKLKESTYPHLSNKYQEGYEDGIKAIMSYLHSEKEWHNLIDD